MKSKVFLVLLLFLGYSVFASWVYLCKVKELCGSGDNGGAQYISFSVNSAKPQLSEDFDVLKENTVSRLGDSNRLLITGLFTTKEINTTSSENLGVARAREVEMLFSDIESSRISLFSEVRDSLGEEGKLDAVRLRILTQNVYVSEFRNGATLFIGDSLSTEWSRPLDVFLTYIANENKGKVVELVAYYYTMDTEEENFERALQNANLVKDKLISQGMDPSRIHATSKGGTNEGDIQDRRNRIELLISE